MLTSMSESGEGRRAIGRFARGANSLSRDHTFAVAVVLLVLAAGAGVGSFLAPGGGPERVTGSISRLGPIEFTLDSAPGEATSPVCGCFKIGHRKDWRGVSFAARKVELSRQIDGRRSTYQVFAAAPEAADWVPSYLLFGTEFLVLSHHRGSGGRFNPSSLAHGRIPSGWSLVHRTIFGGQPLARVTTRDPLFVNMLGPTPIGPGSPLVRAMSDSASTKG
jgi:hypothetical protein